MSKTPADIEHLLHEALSQLGWEADPQRISARLSRLNHGLPREDEFSVVCSWLGKCEVIHKLDQKQMPKASKEQYQVPDLFGAFLIDGKRVPVLVEVKSGKDNVLSFRPDYVAKLKAYACLVRLPLLIAWKHFGVWTLFELSHMRQAQSNFNIDFPTAMTQNLLGVVAGDFSYSLSVGAGLHLRFRKEALLKTEKTEAGFAEEWEVICDDVYYTDGRSQVVRDLPTDVQALFLTWDLQQKENHTPTHITVSFVAEHEHETAVFAHMALVRLLDWHVPAGDKIDWRALLSKSQILDGVEDFGNAIGEALRRGFVHHVLHQVPRTPAAFLSAT